MSVTTPQSVKKFRTQESDFGTTIAQALWQRAAQFANYISASNPIGSIVFFRRIQEGLPFTPDTRYWKLCDGSTITNSASPLVGHATPNLVNHFIREPGVGESIGTVAGSDTLSYPHNHGGTTGDTDDRLIFQLDNGDERKQANVHHHSISTTTINPSTLPPYRMLEAWMRIV